MNGLIVDGRDMGAIAQAMREDAGLRWRQFWRCLLGRAQHLYPPTPNLR
jgi:hypothetical protein